MRKLSDILLEKYLYILSNVSTFCAFVKIINILIKYKVKYVIVNKTLFSSRIVNLCYIVLFYIGKFFNSNGKKLFQESREEVNRSI